MQALLVHSAGGTRTGSHMCPPSGLQQAALVAHLAHGVQHLFVADGALLTRVVALPAACASGRRALVATGTARGGCVCRQGAAGAAPRLPVEADAVAQAGLHVAVQAVEALHAGQGGAL